MGVHTFAPQMAILLGRVGLFDLKFQHRVGSDRSVGTEVLVEYVVATVVPGDVMTVRSLLPTLAVLALVVGCGAVETAPSEPLSQSPDGAVRTTESTQDVTLPEGWRWESFGGVQVGVPGDFDWGNDHQAFAQWCTSDEQGRARAIVGRGGPATEVGCVSDSPTPQLSLENTGTVVGFGWSAGPDRPPLVHGDRISLQMNGVRVAVQAPQPLREHIAATAHVVDLDYYGCPSTHPITQDSTWRPAGPALGSLVDVTGVSICKYQLREAWPTTGPVSPASLIASQRLEREEAAQTIGALAGAPLGGGPDSPDLCAPESAYGEEAIVLLITSSSGPSHVVVRYAGCNHHGIDDGTQLRHLTADSIAPLITEPTAVWQAVGSEMGEILFPDTAEHRSEDG